MREMIRRMLGSEIPIITWVTPSGARAASAGVFITMAGDVAAMAPGTNIGAATPINMQGPMDSTLARKVTNDASAFARTLAAQRGRNGEWAEQAVRQAVSVSETEALKLRVVDLDRRHPSRADRQGRWPLLAARGTDPPARNQGPAERPHRARAEAALLGQLADPNIAYILLMLGFYGLMFELQNPGAILPGVVGGSA